MQNNTEKSQSNTTEKVEWNDPERNKQDETARECTDPERNKQDGQQANAFRTLDFGAGMQDQQKIETAEDKKTRKLKEMMRHPPSFYDMDAEDEELSVYK